jgi:hypothetical protein
VSSSELAMWIVPLATFANRDPPSLISHHALRNQPQADTANCSVFDTPSRSSTESKTSSEFIINWESKELPNAMLHYVFVFVVLLFITINTYTRVALERRAA